MRSILVILSAFALLSLGACAGMYLTGDASAGATDNRHN